MCNIFEKDCAICIFYDILIIRPGFARVVERLLCDSYVKINKNLATMFLEVTVNIIHNP